MISDPARQEEMLAWCFPTACKCACKMNGAGFRDVILNFAHLFDVVLPPELQQAQRPKALGHQAESATGHASARRERAHGVCH